jgi:putative Mg2+ transporter-C (MgtC) family protein
MSTNLITSTWDTIHSNLEGRIIINFIFSIFAGILIGIDREIKGKSAGVSTHCLVISGSMLFSFLSQMVGTDPSRIASQIVTGVGFLGAGIILKVNDKKIGNLTTAASLWFCAAIGMCIGFNLYMVSLISTGMAVIIFRYLPHNKGETEQ